MSAELPFSLNIDAEKINEALAQEIIQSVIGESLKTWVKNYRQEAYGKSVDEVIKNLANREIQNVINRVLKEDLLGDDATLRQFIRDKLVEMLSADDGKLAIKVIRDAINYHDRY